MQAYAEFHGKRIPTEIEWEKAARGGLADMNYPWGRTITPDDANYNHIESLNPFHDGLRSEAVGSYPPNEYGLYDMAGNVSEYVLPSNDIALGEHVLHRGGDWRRPGDEQTVWYRQRHYTDVGFGTIGFRCVKRVEVQR